MFPKVITLTLLLAVLAGGLLLMRHRRLELANRSADLHHRITEARQELWNAQSDAAELLRPDRIRDRLDRSQGSVEPMRPGGRPPSHGSLVQGR